RCFAVRAPVQWVSVVPTHYLALAYVPVPDPRPCAPMRIRLFARARDLAGTDALDVDLPAGATVAELRRRLAAEHPALARLVGHCAFAVNDEFADDALPLPAGADVALLPPVSGG